ncbi:PKD domain-containing protein [Arthrobacter sp. H14]|uniref:PKD domain-containing protein n=1 Tax=Arthrobacter sp. H14 TaxID=1312959 RepID=UPI0020A68AB3|nr:PKD domain-containing protein [Arthrobacter sp. H14]
MDQNNVSIACEVNRRQCDAREGGVLGQWYYFDSSQNPGEWIPQGGLICRYPPEPGEDVQSLPTFTLNDFQQLPIAAGTSIVQPQPHTLVGAHTNVSAEAEPQNFSVEVAGYQIEVNAKPVAYQWNYGDGHVFGPTQSAGLRLPQNRWGEQTATSHMYEQTGDYNVTLTTLYNGEFSVDGGPWIPIPGQAEVESAPVTISVWRSETNNYADNCFENPQGAGCQGAGG